MRTLREYTLIIAVVLPKTLRRMTDMTARHGDSKQRGLLGPTASWLGMP
jgi:hypothetical protein